RISEEALAESLGISRTPVREAIRKLQSEGLVVQFPRVGTFVCKPNRREIRELCEEREALEAFAAESAAERASAEQLAEIGRLADAMRRWIDEERAAARGQPSAKRRRIYGKHDLSFHDHIARAAGNQRIHRLLFGSQLMSRLFIHKRDLVEPLADLAAGAQEHVRIAAALAARDGAEARRWMERHNRRGKDLQIGRASCRERG